MSVYQVWPRDSDPREFRSWLAARWYQLRCWLRPHHVATDAALEHLAKCTLCCNRLQTWIDLISPSLPLDEDEVDAGLTDLKRRIECEKKK